MGFKRYMHVERFGKTAVEGIEIGTCYIFPKLDGTNASIWKEGSVMAGSRNKQLSIIQDNAGFCSWVNNFKGCSIFKDKLTWRLYGEWLVPHTLKTYREDAWRKFYVFDVFDDSTGEYIKYDEYLPIIEKHGFDFIQPISIIKNPTYENLLHELENNKFLIRDGSGIGEGIVVKNYGYQNKFGKTIWAKIVHDTFRKTCLDKKGSYVKILNKMVEEEFCDMYVTKHLIEKVYAKIVNVNGGWSSKDIPRLLQTVFYDLVTEEVWDFVKKKKLPTINFKTLNTLTVIKIKEIKPELF